MATTDVAVFDGTGWVSISGSNGAPGADGKSIELSPAPPSSATNVANIDDNTPGLATLTLHLNADSSDATKNVYDLAVGVPVGIRGEKGEAGTGVNILGEKPSQGDLPASGDPGDAWLIGGDLWVWDAENGSWVDVGSIQGPPGQDGQDGQPGNAATVSATASANQVACDQAATAVVTNNGDANAAQFAFVFDLPQGCDGEKGDPGQDGENAEVYVQSVDVTPTAKNPGAIWIGTAP